MRVARRTVTILAALAMIVLPGGLLVMGSLWLYRHIFAGRAHA